MASARSGKAFDFVAIDMPPKKPREVGVVEFRGPYYSSVTYGYLKDLLDDWGEYVDGYKFAGGSMRLLRKEKVRQIIRTCHDHRVYVSTGGFVERVIVQGSSAVDEYLRECKTLDFDVVEVSSGLASIPLEDKIRIVKQVQKLGMKPKPEVSMMIGAGAGTHVVGYETEMKMRSFDDFVGEVDAHLKAGAKMIMVESEGLTEDLPPDKWRRDVIQKLVDRFGYRPFMFEASDPPVFKWYLTTFGRDVNLFIDHSQIVEFTAWRTRLWGDESIWQGKKLSYRPQEAAAQ
jgi:phosphosulfolactate synthase (CoM biosynthesis protein A)